MSKPNNTNMTTAANNVSNWDKFSLALSSLQKESVNVCLMRDDPAEHQNWIELDVLIPGDKADITIEVLESLGWKTIDTGRFIPLKRAMILLHKNCLLKLDIHFALVDGPYVYMDAGWMHSNASSHAIGVNVPAPEAWFLHVVHHVILGKDCLHDKYKARLTSVVQSGIDENEILQQADKFGLKEITKKIIDDPVSLLSDQETVKGLKRESTRRLLFGSLKNQLRWLKYKFMWSIGQLLLLRRGVVIAVVGPDGAGKTTFLTELKTALKQLEIPSRTQYMGPWEYPILPTSKLLRKLGASPQDKIANTDQALPASTRIPKLVKGYAKRYLYYCNIVFEMWARYLLKIFPHVMLRRVVIADRYIYDLELGYYNSIVKNSLSVRRLITRLVPKPDITILLDNDAETIWERKKEYPLDVIEQSLEKYHELARRYQFQVVRTDIPSSETVEKFIQDNWVFITEIRKDG